MSRLAACVALVLSLPSAVRAEEVVYQFRTQEDPGVEVDRSVCRSAPFRVNLQLPASVSVPVHRMKDGQVVVAGYRRVGSAMACVKLTDISFPGGLRQDFYVRFELPEGRFTALGQCAALSNEVPQRGVVLTGCALKLTEFPAGYVGGFATSASVFNPLGLPGFNTGSYWTLRVFEGEKAPAQGSGRSGMEWVEDARTDEDIAALAQPHASP